jgi:amino acid adenylation domain-containing protein
LHERACRLAATVQRERRSEEVPLTAVFAHRSEVAFDGVLGALLAGHGYVPLNRTFPPARSRGMLVASKAETLIADAASEPQLGELLAGIEHSIAVLLPERDSGAEAAARFSNGKHRFFGMRELSEASAWCEEPVSPDAIAYLLFTSGSTGAPKGVGVTNRNARSFIDFIGARHGFTPEDRFSQTFSLTFDLSVFDMFVAWSHGASLWCPTDKQLIKPGRYIKESELTVWFSVPSTIAFMGKLGELKPDRYPSLRMSLFCGEPLPLESAERWLSAAPSSILENLYGPTELTIACTAYRFDRERTRAEAERGFVPIGEAYPHLYALVANDDLRSVAHGEAGELLIAGPQVVPGYWGDAERTGRAFVVPPGEKRTFYRTGDLVRRRTAESPLVWLGRVDHQIKVHGHRVELGEIESAIRDLARLEAAVAIGWPKTESGAGGIVAFVQRTLDFEALKGRLEERLPKYMVPSELRVVADWPLNSNGKIDRNALAAMLEAEGSA